MELNTVNGDVNQLSYDVASGSELTQAIKFINHLWFVIVVFPDHTHLLFSRNVMTSITMLHT